MTIKELTPSQAELFDACRQGDYDRVRTLLSSKKHKRPRTPLNIFRASGNSSQLSALRDPTSTYTTLHYSALKNHEQVSKLLLDYEPQLATCRDKRGCVALHLAAWGGHLSIVKMLITADPQSVDYTNVTMETPLHLAAQHGHIGVVRLLLEKHANPMLRNIRFEGPLDIAARVGHADVCKAIADNCPELALQAACDSSATTVNGIVHVVYPLHVAARYSHIECLQVLRKCGFNLNFVTEEGSALHVAATFGQVDAVRYLIKEGINTEIRNSRNQTVLEMLGDMEKQGGSEVTQIIQSRGGWADCRQLIEVGSKKLQSDQLNSSSDSGIDRRDSERYTRRNYPIDTDHEAIWKQLPKNASVQYYPDQRKQAKTNPIYSPPSMVADFRDNSPDDSVCELSTMSENSSFLNSTTDSALSRTWNSRMYVQGVPKFPLTSPYNKTRHVTSQRTSDTLPTNFSGIRTKPVTSRGSILPQNGDDTNCVYRSPPQYTEWQSARVPKTQNCVPTTPYDNVPNVKFPAYENGRSERQWQHSCTGSIGRATGSHLASLKQQEGTQTLPGRSRLRTMLNTSVFSPIIESPNTTTGSNSSPQSKLNTSRTTCDREESLGLTNSPRLDTRTSSIASSLTLACSTIDRTLPIKTINGRAPLALPEELPNSAANSIMGQSMSTDRESRENSVTVIENINGHGDDHSLSSKVQREELERTSWPDVPPSPNTSQAAIFDALYGSTGSRGRLTGSSRSNGIPLSPTTTDCSDSTVASSCSLQMISQLSITPPSVQSPSKHRSQRLSDQDSSSCSGVRMRPEYRNVEMQSSKLSSSGSTRSINMAEEWKQIDEILASYGAAPCRESVFVREYEPQVAIFLRDRRSQALTLQLLNTRPNSLELDKKRKHPTNILSVPEWLEMKVGLAAVIAGDIGALLVKYGYDRYTQLKGCLNYEIMGVMGIPKSIQIQVMQQVEGLEERRPNAGNFNYISDWLCSLELTDYLGNFVNNGFKSMVIVRNSNMNEIKLAKIGIELPGHVARILHSLKNAEASNKEETRTKNQYICSPDHYEPIEANAAMKRSATASPTLDMTEKQEKLLTGGIYFSAHFMGRHEISNIDGTEESRRVMDKVKKSIRETVNVPQVFLEVSIDGVQIFDHTKKNVIAVHEVSRIQIVCQDERDLNCFTYITQDGDQHFCHVYCVLTADVATEIIVTLGQAFELAYKLQNGLPLDKSLVNPSA